MNRVVMIKDILDHLHDEKIEYTFKGNESEVIEGFSTLFNYKPKTITFISTLYKFEDYKGKFENKTIRLIITDPSEGSFDCFENVIQIKKPTNAFFSILDNLYNDESKEQILPLSSDRDYNFQHSYISEKAEIGKNVKIGYGCVIEANVAIGNNTEIHHNVIIKSGTKIGGNCFISSGTVIGEQGFNPSTQKDGSKKLLKHFGGVKIGSNVHIGSNCNIHKGSIDDTILQDGVKLNTMVHVAHNCIIGENTVITMPTHICGSVKIGRNCHVAAVTIRNQCEVGDHAVLGLGAVVIKDVKDGITVVGNPARPLVK